MPVCASAVLPAVSFNFCDPDIRLGEIDRVYITRASSADVLTDVADADEWALRLNQSATIPGSGAAPIRELTGIGELVEPEVTETEISDGRKTSSLPKNTLNLDIDELSITNISAARTYQQNPAATHKAWFRSGGLMYGGNDGIDVSLVARLIIPRGKTEVSQIKYTLKWDGYIPSAVASPI